MPSCPSCGSGMLVSKTEKRFSLVCLRCGIRYFTAARDERAAYENFMAEFEKGKLKLETARSFEELKREISKEGIEFELLPNAVKKLLLQKENVKYKLFKESEANYGSAVEKLNLHPAIKRFLRGKNIARLYEFQERAIEAILEDKNVVIVAPTASGKTEAFALPVVQKILEEKKSGIEINAVKALFIYPTKALARDQMQKLRAVEEATGVRFAVYDGDTTPAQRKKILESPPDILITNPDMLHLHLMRRYSDFRRLILTARFVVLDEIHEYIGAFGANLHFILRRLRRFCNFQMIGASATVGNPKEFAEKLFNASVEVIEEAQSKHGRMHFLMLYPHQRSYTSLILDALRELIGAEYRTLVFANSHKDAEAINRVARKSRLNVAIHRAGLTKRERHTVEDAFKAGKLAALIATPTLELGIDIGSVDAVVSMIVNFTRLVQRIGRAGRKGQESIAVLALRGEDPISTFYKNYPEKYFTDIEPAYVEPANEVLAYYQLLAAARDKPIGEEEFGEFEQVKQKLLAEGLLWKSARGFTPDYKAAGMALLGYNIRGIGGAVAIKCNNRKLGERAMPMAARELHPGALYLHGGELYRGKEFKFSAKAGEAIVEKAFDENLKTEALRFSLPEIVEIYETRKAFAAQMLYCKLRITEVVHGYVLKEIFSDRKIEEKTLEEPIKYSYETRGFLFAAPFPDRLPYMDAEENLAGTFHAVEHVIIESSNMLVGGGAGEIGGIATSNGVIFVHDGAQGGNGLSKLLYDRFEEAAKRALSILQSCNCQRMDGCPSCTYSYRCGNNNKPLFKAGAIESLELLISGVETKAAKEELKEEKSYV